VSTQFSNFEYSDFSEDEAGIFFSEPADFDIQTELSHQEKQKRAQAMLKSVKLSQFSTHNFYDRLKDLLSF
jgi:hypothetical protein